MLVALGLMNPYTSPLHPLFVWNLQWLNDIENDPAYRSWPSGVQELLRATFPGVIRQIRRNFFNLVSPPGHQDYDQEPKKQVHRSLFCLISLSGVGIFSQTATQCACCLLLLKLQGLKDKYQDFFNPNTRHHCFCLPGVVPRSRSRGDCGVGETGGALLQAQDPSEVGAAPAPCGSTPGICDLC